MAIKTEITPIEMTRGMIVASYMIREEWVSLASLKARNVEYNELATLRDYGWLEEKIEPHETGGSVFSYRKIIVSKCRICGEPEFKGSPLMGQMRPCSNDLGHLLEPITA